MKRGLGFVGAILLSVAQPVGAEPSPGVLKVLFGDASPPVYWSTSEDGLQGKGLVPDLVEAIGREAGFRVDAEFVPLMRVQNLVEAGERDAMVNVLTPARLAYAVASREPLFTSPVKVFVRKDSPLFASLQKATTLDELARVPATVGALLGSGWTKTNLESRGMKIEYSSGTSSGVEKLIAHRVDIVVDVSLNINWILKTLPGGSEVVELPNALQTVGWHLLVSKRSPWAAKLADLDAAIARVLGSSSYRTIVARYGIRPLPTSPVR